MRSHHLLISAGEVSGDLQGSLLIQSLHQEAVERNCKLKITALGGERMAAAGAALLANTTRIGAIGLFESLPYVRSTLVIQQQLRAFLKTTPPDLTVLIDYPGANIPLADYLKRTYSSSLIVYYIAPQEWVWAFGKGTTRQIVERTDQILSIFPEEAEYYTAHGAKATWIGHPFVDALASCPSRVEARQQLGIPPAQTAIALLPASRQQELRHILPVLSAAAQQIQQQVPTAHFYIPVAHEGLRRSLQTMIAECSLHATLTEDAHLTLAAVDLTIGKSGTVNLETALLGIPQIVVYRVHPVSGWLYRKLLGFKVPYISPVNIVAKQAIVPELLQEAATPDAIAQLALELLQPSELRSQMLEGYRLHLTLGERGVLKRAANLILDALSP